MNFFEQQDRARTSTLRLVVLFIVAIAVLVAVTSWLAVLALGLANQRHKLSIDPVSMWQFMPGVALVIISVVLLGALYRISQLRGGGKVVAEQMGGTLLTGHATALDERKILNVVEEMAIASGVPVPPVYVIEDDGINAFAAGYHPQDAVIGITRGAIHLLDRDELQGVIAHEFSHIFNGDMRLNLRLIGWLHGLLLIALFGGLLLRMPRFSGRDKNNAGLVLLALGLIFTVLGYAGVLFGNLIKAAVSRQREFLADASAVQFTRNPAGIGNALKKIGGYPQGSRLQASDTSEISHLLFGAGSGMSSFFLFATHPPLEERIKRIEPNWDGSMVVPDARTTATDEQHAAGSSAAARSRGVMATAVEAVVVAAVGTATQQSLSRASEQLSGIPDALRQQLATPLDAMLLLCALPVVLATPDIAQQQLQLLQKRLSVASCQLFNERLQQLQSLPRELDLVLVSLAQPTLRQLSPSQWEQFTGLIQQLADVDGERSVQEWALLLLLQHYQRSSDMAAASKTTLVVRSGECALLLSVLAKAGAATPEAAAVAFDAAWSRLDVGSPAQYQPEATLEQAETAIQRLATLRPLQKPALLKALVCCVQNDGVLTAVEITLLRTVATLLDCPLPPLG